MSELYSTCCVPALDTMFVGTGAERLYRSATSIPLECVFTHVCSEVDVRQGQAGLEILSGCLSKVNTIYAIKTDQPTLAVEIIIADQGTVIPAERESVNTCCPGCASELTMCQVVPSRTGLRHRS